MVDRATFPIPDDLEPDTICFQFQMPNTSQWKAIFRGLLAQPQYWFNWERDGAHSGRTLGQYWGKLYDQIDWSQMSCCPEPLKRLNSNGSMSVSFDDGATWQPAGNLDPRNTAVSPPPIPGDDGDDKKCKSANSMVRQLKDQQIAYSSKIGVITTVLEMAASLVGLAVLVFFDPALAPFLIGAFFELAAALLATTSMAYDALFTDDDWGWILCELFCKMTADGQIPASEFVNIQSDFDSHFSGNAALTFSSILAAWQLPGLNNAGKIPTTDNLDCSGCCPTCDADTWFLGAMVSGSLDVVGTETLHTSTTIEAASGDRGDGQQFIYITTKFADVCCNVHIEILTGAVTATVGISCGTDPDASHFVSLGLSPPDNMNSVGIGDAAPFTARFTFSL